MGLPVPSEAKVLVAEPVGDGDQIAVGVVVTGDRLAGGVGEVGDEATGVTDVGGGIGEVGDRRRRRGEPVHNIVGEGVLGDGVGGG